ncbi:hypothetical protein DXK94_15000 [Arthrobacter sp. RT-1]|nr:hypothetical protein DXK94_15000 [Arthrobacter sp. RT-1]
MADGDFLVVALMRGSARLGAAGIPPVHLVEVLACRQHAVGRNDVLIVLVAQVGFECVEAHGD